MFNIGPVYTTYRYKVGLPNITLIQLSDLHFEDTQKKFPKTLRTLIEMQVIRIFLESENPVAIVVTGDIVDKYITDSVLLSINMFFRAITNCIEEQGHTEKFLGITIALGNHDYLHDSQRLTLFLNRLPYCRVLEDDFIFLLTEGSKQDVLLYGCKGDPYESFDRARLFTVGTTPENLYKIALVHNPGYLTDDNFKYNFLRFNLVLCGHTHGAQIFLPGLFLRLPRKLRHFITGYNGHMCKYQKGIFKPFHTSNTRIIVSAGLGSHKPGRIFQPPSINVIT